MVIRMMSCDQQQSVGADADAGRKRGVVTDAWLAACGGSSGICGELLPATMTVSAFWGVAIDASWSWYEIHNCLKVKSIQII